MAIDTQTKRASTFGIGLPFRLVLPWADAAIDQGDRQHVAGLYAGILAGEVVEIIRPGTALLYRVGPGSARLDRSGPGAAIVFRTGPGAATIEEL